MKIPAKTQKAMSALETFSTTHKAAAKEEDYINKNRNKRKITRISLRASRGRPR